MVNSKRTKILENSIAVIGPKQVGKTFVCAELAKDKSTPDFVLSSDLLTSLLIYDINGMWNSVVIGSELEEVGTLYKKTFNFTELKPLVESIAKCYQNERFSPKEKRVAMSYWKARLLEDATEMLDKPFILDAGADVGAVFELSNNEELNVAQAFYMPYDFIEDRLSSYLKDFATVVYLKPGKTYAAIEGRAKDAENTLYLESGKSYEQFSTVAIDCDTLYTSSKPKEETVKTAIAQITANYHPSTFGE